MRKKEKEIWKKYEDMDSYEKSIVHNGWYRYWRVRNGECQWLINDKQNNKEITNILKRERNEKLN